MEHLTLQSIKNETDRLQSLASHPDISAWVSANAGTGKTYVLVQRVLRLLLNGTKPEKILCLTFTKAAASEMANRLFEKLSVWTIADDETLNNTLASLLKRQPSDKHRKDARKLFAKALETPGGLKVQTIHAFCERLLQRFPLEAQVAPHFTVLDDDAQKELLTTSTTSVLSKAVRMKDSELGRALLDVIAYAGQDRFDELLQSVLSKRGALQQTLDQAFAGDGVYDLREGLRSAMCQSLALSPSLSQDDVYQDADALLRNADLSYIITALLDGKKTDQGIAEHLRAWQQTSSQRGRFDVLAKVFLKTDGAPRSDSRFLTKQIREDHPNIIAQLTKARDLYHRLSVSLEGLRVAQASSALLFLANEIAQQYDQAKQMRAALDFDDLIQKTSSLLARPGVSAWVLYKLDQGIDHILVDEAQDTSPTSWSVIEYLADEFFSGLGARDVARTVFAVGDEKQSIYGFQGAEPKKFAQMGDRFAQKAEHAQMAWERIPLTLSFRSTAPVLRAVDFVFAQSAALQGLTAEHRAVKHAAFREQHAGYVEIWETEKFVQENTPDPWAVSQTRSSESPIFRLANRIGDTIQSWFQRNEILESQGRPIRPSDILILVRKREPFVTPMIRALKARQIPVAGADRIRLGDQIAVMDLIALGEFLLMPEDDLNLATVLKSPFFDLTDDDLFAIGHERRASLWEALNTHADLKPEYEDIAITLRQWLARADLMPPFEFYSGVLLSRERRARFISRLGPEAGDAIDEFLNMAIRYDDMAPSSLQGFLSWIRQADTEIKRDMEQGRNEVRIMTVHGAKGLEANIIFMPDTCSRRSSQSQSAILETQAVAPNEDQPGALFWALPGTKRQEVLEAARDVHTTKEREEYHRLLYVAMTRARDRLYVAGFENKTKKGRDDGCWYDLIYNGLLDHCTPDRDHFGHSVLTLQSLQTQPVLHTQDAIIAQEDVQEPPDWAFRKAPNEPVRAIPVSPCLLVPLDVEDAEDIDLGDQEAISPRALVHENRYLRGILTHALLEHLPRLDPTLWDEAAQRLVEIKARDVSKVTRDSIVRETLAILRDPQFGVLFGEHSQSEVSITAKIPERETGGAPVLISGQIDRLAVLEDRILIVDYKTNRPPPMDPKDVAPSYLAQLVAYRRALSDITLGESQSKPILCALLWTDGPRLMEIPSQLLDHVEAELRVSGWRKT